LQSGILRVTSMSWSGVNQRLDAKQLIVDGDVDIDGATLLLATNSTVQIGGNVNLTNTAKLTVPNATISPKVVNKLAMSVGGTLTIDATSLVDLNGKGYPSSYWSGPDFVDSNGGRWACYGGKRSNTSANCTYGRYEDAQFAGSAGQYHNGSAPALGGGVFELSATALVLDGTIRANGLPGYYTNGGGAGGGIHLMVDSLSGAGVVVANGGGNTWASRPGGGGGRVAIYTSDWSTYTGQLQARGSANGSHVAGAGTVYVKLVGEGYGHLLVDNGGHVAAAGSTPVRSVGQHLITDAQLTGIDTWVITVAGTPWRTSDIALGWGIDGIEVDLDASEELSAHYQIVSNTENTLTVMAADDLTGVVGNDLLGVHTFETYTQSGGASASFSGDRLIQLQ